MGHRYLHKDTVLAARLMKDLATDKLVDEVEQNPVEDWLAHCNQSDYEGRWDVLPLRCAGIYRESHPVLQSFSVEVAGEWENLPRLTHAPYLLQVLSKIKCPLKSVRLMRLAPGAQIKPHRDLGLALEYGEARLHLPVCTDRRVRFYVGGCSVPMRQGELWYMNADAEHSVVNKSSEHRVHLVVDCEVNEWLRSAVTNPV